MPRWNWSATPQRGSPARRRTVCLTCAKMIVNAGIRRIVFSGDYPDPLARQMLEQAGIALGQVAVEPISA